FGYCTAQNTQPNWAEGPAMNDVRRHKTYDPSRDKPPFVKFENDN
ncbi:unnamed protein product, partial [Auanema sp. JU1783]